MIFLKQIDLENFKSWRGKQVIGPFMRFNCIIGTNGSGKSNVMDALSFAIGEYAPCLRVKQLRDLVHGAHVGAPVSDTARVALRFSDDQDRETVFCRSVVGNSCEYCISGKHVTRAKYLEELQKIGIVTKARNCLVFQGAVESIALKDPRERTKMFECISESKALAALYNEKKDALMKAKEDTQFHFNKKKNVHAEKKQLSQEKMEAERYQALVDDLQQNRLQLSLAELYENERNIEACSSTLRERQQAAAVKNTELEKVKQTEKTRKKEHGRLTREQLQAEKEMRSQEHTQSQCQAQYIKAKVNSSHHTKKAEEARKALRKSVKQMALMEKDLEEGQREISELKTTWRLYERQVQEEVSQATDIQLDEDQLQRYMELKELARKRGAVLSQQAEKLIWEVRAEQEKLVFDQRRKKEMEAAVKNHKNQLEDLTGRAEKLEEYTRSCNLSLEEFQQKEESLSKELEHGRQRSEEVNQELGEVVEELRSAGLESHESKRQLRRKEILEKMHRRHPQSVYGRLCDLCSPIHKKYQLAVTRVFGRYMNAIVVPSETVAFDCIRFLKQEHAEPETFLPLDNLDVTPPNERLRELAGVKMLVDLVQINAAGIAAQLRRVVWFVCGNTLVCDTIKEARSMAFDRQEHRKTVSLDGTLFAKSGVITGGAKDLRFKARCWDEKAVTELKERKQKLANEMRDLMKLRRKEVDLKQVTAQAQGVKTRLKYAKNDLENLRKRLIFKCQADISCMESELANLNSQIQMQQDSVEAKDAELKTIKDQIEQEEDLVFSDFCAEIRVGSIREYEQQQSQSLQAELEKKRLEFESHFAHLNAELEYNQNQLEQQKRKLRKMEETIDQEERLMAEQKTAEEKLLLVVEEAQNKLLDLNNLLTLKKSQVNSVKAELDQEARKIQEINKELVELQREAMCAETALEQQRLARHNLLLRCKIQDLPVVLLSGQLDEISEVQLDPESESTAATLHIYDREAQLIIDYSGLEAELGAEEELEAFMKRLQESVYQMEGMLIRTTGPNLKALEKMSEVKDKFQGVREAFDASTKVARKCHYEFEQVKGQRSRLFNKCFEHVSVATDQIYKRICRNSSAQAILSAENPDEPYLGGINYHCVAPGKRFMSMDNLSGGEKAIAALALLFAIHSFHPAPFFILDEVDAALDNTNISKVTSFIREESEENMQIIVISLKEEFFSKADALLGIYSEIDEYMFSRVLTLDLRPFPLAEESDERPADTSRMELQ